MLACPQLASQCSCPHLARLYQDLDGQVTGDDVTQRWVVETSKASGQNLLPYFDQVRCASEPSACLGGSQQLRAQGPDPGRHP